MKKFRLSAALAAMTVVVSAQAALERVGPNNPDPSVGNYPAWYQDTTGLSIEFCNPLNQAEVNGGWCLLLPGDVTIPEVFPTNFFDEHFYFAAGATLAPRAPAGNTATLTLAVEAAFASGAAAPGQQITFARIRVRLNTAPVSGTYRFIHPYGEEVFENVAAGSRIFFTDDVGINCPPGGPFDCALASRLGPFLLPSSAPGGAEIAAVPGPVPGKLYIADPARTGPVTGSTLPPFVNSLGVSENHNVFRIEGPTGSGLGGPGVDFIETTGFTLQGRIFNAAIPGRVTVDRASYARTATLLKLDVFATGLSTTQGRLPAGPAPAAVSPALSFFPAPCTVGANGALSAPVGVAEVQMFNADTAFWGQTQPAALPTDVCVKDSAARDVNGAIVPAFFARKVADDVKISQAVYDPAASSLSVTATSSDVLVPPILTVAGFGEMLAGTNQLVVSPLAAPFATVRVLSSAGGTADIATEVGTLTVVPPVGPVAVNDAVTFAEDSGLHSIPVLANDTNVAGGTVTLVTQPRLGTAVLLPDGSVNYTPNPNAFGADAFTYRVTVAGVASNIGNVAVTLTPVNDPPVAVADGPFTVNLGAATALNLRANDTDPDGAADVVSSLIVTQPAAGASVTVSPAGVVTFTATVAGSYTFTYRAVDAAGATSVLPATVTVTAIGADVVTAASATFRTGQLRWIITGTNSVPNVPITLTYVDGAAAGRVIGTATAVGNAWTLDIRNVPATLDPRTPNPRPTRVRATSPLGGTATVNITTRQ